MRSLQAAVASGSIDVCAALLLHGASLEVDLAIPGIPAEVRSLLELFKGRPPQAGDRKSWTRLDVNTVLIMIQLGFRIHMLRKTLVNSFSSHRMLLLIILVQVKLNLKGLNIRKR